MSIRRKSLPNQSEKLVVVKRRASLNLFGSNQNVLPPIADKEKGNTLLRWLKFLVYGNDTPRLQYEKETIKENRIIENLGDDNFLDCVQSEKQEIIRDEIILIDKEIKQALSEKEMLILKEFDLEFPTYFQNLKNKNEPLNLLLGSEYHVNQIILQVNESLNIFDAQRKISTSKIKKMDVPVSKIFKNITSLKEYLNLLLTIIKKEEEEEQEFRKQLQLLQEQIMNQKLNEEIRCIV